MIEGRLERALAAIGRLAYRHAALVMALFLGSLVPLGWLALDIEVSSSFLDLLPREEPPVAQLEEVLEHARSTSDVVIAISTEDRALAERFGRALVEELEANPEVAGIGGYVDRAWFSDRRILFVPESDLEELVGRVHDAIDREIGSTFDLGLDDDLGLDGDVAPEEDPESLLAELEAQGESALGTSDWVATSDGRYLAVWAYFAGNSGDLAFGRHAWQEVRDAVDGLRDGERFPRDLEVRYAGGIPSRVEDERALVADLRIAGTVGFCAVVLLIVLALRTPRALLLLSVPLFIGLVWTFAFARLAVGHLNIISGFLFSILSGLGIEYGIHLLHRYRELREEGLALEPAIERLVATTGRALLSGSMTNAGVFAVIALAQFRGFSEFGLIAAVGLLLTLVATLLGLPALLVLLERIRPVALVTHEVETPPVSVPRPLRWLVVVAVPLGALLSLGVLLSGGTEFDGNWRHLASDTETTRFGEYLRHQLSGTYDQALLWVPEEGDLPRVESAIEALREERTARGAPFDVVDVLTLDDVFPSPEEQAARAALAVRLGAELDRIHPERLDDAGRERLEEGRRVLGLAVPFGLEAMPYSVVGHLLTRDGHGTIVHLRAPETDDADTGILISWSRQAEEISSTLHDEGIDAPMLSENWIAGEIFERIAGDATFLSFATVLAVFLVLLLDLRRPLVAAAVLGSVLLGVVSMAGLAWLFGVRLNFMNVAILPVCVSISLDNAIHVFHRWREGGPGSIPSVLRHTTRANALASATNLLGFLALLLTHHDGLRSVAYLATLGVVSTYVSTTLWFPMVLDTIDDYRGRRPAPDPSPTP